MENATFAALRVLWLLDLTNLDDNCTPSAIDQLCHRARQAEGPPAAVCVWPQFVTQSRRLLAATPIKVATVVNFPHGDHSIDRVRTDVEQSLADGANEIDLVIPYKAFLAGDEVFTRDMIEAIVDATEGKALLKVILETGAFPDPATIARASQLAIEAGTDFIKTSTGKIAVSATPEAARIMLEMIRATGGKVGFKAAGGIRSLEDAQIYLDLVDDIMGRQWAQPETFRFGASSLLEVLEKIRQFGEAQPVPAAGSY